MTAGLAQQRCQRPGCHHEKWSHHGGASRTHCTAFHVGDIGRALCSCIEFLAPAKQPTLSTFAALADALHTRADQLLGVPAPTQSEMGEGIGLHDAACALDLLLGRDVTRHRLGPAAVSRHYADVAARKS